MKFEYKVKTVEKSKDFSKLSDDGWELVCATTHKSKFYFRRELPDEFSTITNKGGLHRYGESYDDIISKA